MSCRAEAEESSPQLDTADLDAAVERSVATAHRLRDWWDRADAAQDFECCFPLVRAFNLPVSAYGFFHTVTLDNQSAAVMGVAQDMLYDTLGAGPRHSRAADHLRYFVLRYFLRVSDFRRPEAFAEPPAEALSRPQLLGVGAPQEGDWAGFGYAQLYYRLAASGDIGHFPESEMRQIVDLREIGSRYRWIVASVRIFDFNILFRPLGPDTPALTVPLDEQSLIVLTPEFVVCRDRPRPGVEAEFGFGYALLPSETTGGFLAFGPGRFRFGFQTIGFQLLTSGNVRVRLVFVVNRPEGVLRIPLNPIRWGWALADLLSFGAATHVLPEVRDWLLRNAPEFGSVDPVFTSVALINGLTGGAAGRDLGLTRQQIEKQMLLQHFRQHYDLITGSLSTWRQFPDWTDETQLPRWVVSGRAD